MIMTKVSKERAESLLESIKPELLKLLANAPAYGLCGIELRFHNSRIARIALKAEVIKLLEKEG